MSTVAENTTYEKRLLQVLDILEEAMSEEVEEQVTKDWIDFLEGRCQDDIFKPERKYRKSLNIKADPILKPSVNEALENPTAMLLQQYCGCLIFVGFTLGADRRLTYNNNVDSPKISGKISSVRANYGSSVLAGIFGAEIVKMEDHHNTLPGSLPLSGKDEIKRLIRSGVPSFKQGYPAMILETTRRFKEIADKYPKIGKYIRIYYPDLQGPLDICEVLWGSDVYYAFYDEADLVKDFLELITETYISFLEEWLKIVPPNPVYNCHWNCYIKGLIALRTDSAMNLSPEMYEEFSFPYDKIIMEKFNGGMVHFCGRGDHYIEKMSELPGLCAINMSQPHMNDMDKIYNATIRKGIKILSMPLEEVKRATSAGIKYNGHIMTVL